MEYEFRPSVIIRAPSRNDALVTLNSLFALWFPREDIRTREETVIALPVRQPDGGYLVP